MRHVGGVLVGFVGAIVGGVLVVYGMGLALRSVQTLEGEPLAGAALTLFGGLVLGGVVVAGRWSRAAPLTGAIVLAAVSALAFGGIVYSLGLRPSGTLGDGVELLLGTQVGMAFAGVLLVAALAGGRRTGPTSPYTGSHPPYPRPS